MNELLNLMNHISSNVDVILAYIEKLKKPAINELQETWIDGQEVMQALHISKRTLQSLRDTGVLPFSRLNGKFYYKIEDLKHLSGSIIPMKQSSPFQGGAATQLRIHSIKVK